MQAVKDYYYLTERGYPRKGVLMLVGNRYGLSDTQRTILYRGIASETRYRRRKKKLISSQKIQDQNLHIDGFNVLTTIASSLLGKVLFISSDHILRDASGMKGKHTFSNKMVEAVV